MGIYKNRKKVYNHTVIKIEGGHPMKLRIEECDGEEEVVVYCKSKSERIRRIEIAVERILSEDGEMVLTLGDTEFYVPKKELLFFETADGKVTAHTRENMYYTGLTLQNLEETLPHNFIRVSKSCIVNASRVCALSKNVTGQGEVLFRDTSKRAFVSRGYYKDLKQKVYELHQLDT
jgi:DNA-binding LytR/AlgR family response regulator